MYGKKRTTTALVVRFWSISFFSLFLYYIRARVLLFCDTLAWRSLHKSYSSSNAIILRHFAFELECDSLTEVSLAASTFYALVPIKKLVYFKCWTCINNANSFQGNCYSLALSIQLNCINKPNSFKKIYITIISISFSFTNLLLIC